MADHISEDGEYLIVSFPSKVSPDHCLDIVVYHIVSPCGGKDDGPLFFRDGWTNSEDLVESVAEAEKFLSGLKWDGCFNFEFTEQKRAMLHTCGRDQAAGIGALLGEIYDLAAKEIPRWDDTSA